MKPFVYLSLGAGVQSSALLVMAALGLRGCPKADAAIFADTQDEPKWVYRQLAALKEWAEPRGVQVKVVTVGKLSSDEEVSVPAFVEPVKDDNGTGMLTRTCTWDYKTRPIRKLARSLMKQAGKRQAICLMGISQDEAHRAKDSGRKWLQHLHPLLDLRMTRSACAALLVEHGLPVPRKSACVFCPFRSDGAWREVRDHDPEGFEAACRFDDAIQAQRGAYVHRSLIPLRQVDFGIDHPRLWQDGFGNECEGHCGV